MLSNTFKDKVQLIVYLTGKFNEEGLSVIKAMELIFLADVYAIRNYADTITRDDYFAVKNGPVASTITSSILGPEDYKELSRTSLISAGIYEENSRNLRDSDRKTDIPPKITLKIREATKKNKQNKNHVKHLKTSHMLQYRYICPKEKEKTTPWSTHWTAC